MRADGVPGSISKRESFREYVRGYEPRAVFPHLYTIQRICDCVDELQFEERQHRIGQLKEEFKGCACVGLQLDMYTDHNTHTCFAVLNMTTVVEPSPAGAKEMAVPQLLLRSEVLDYDLFPSTEHTGNNIATWLRDRLKHHNVPFGIIAGITPDGAADGQKALNSIAELGEKTDTCNLHQLQRAVLIGLGLAGTPCKNEAAKNLITKHRRVVQLSNQSREVTDGIHDRQVSAGIPLQKILTTTDTAPTRWGNQYLQIKQNCILRPVLDATVEQYKRNHKGRKDAIVDNDPAESNKE